MEKQINIKVDGETYDRLKDRAEAEGGRSIASLIRQVLQREMGLAAPKEAEESAK
jgi:hypothetical protein